MTNNTYYQTNNETISLEKMQFNVISRRPKYDKKEFESIKMDIEKELFSVFQKYE